MAVKPVIGFAIAGVLVMLVSLASLWSARQNEQAADLQTLRGMSTANELFSDLKDAESGQRGYLATGDEIFLEPYLAVRDTFTGQLSKLRQLTRDNSAQQRRLDILSPLIGDKMALLEQTIELRRKQDGAAALLMLSSGRGKQLMDTIRVQFRDFDREEERRLQREAQFRDNQSQLSTLILLANALFVLLIALASYLLHRESSRRIAAKIKSNSLLEQAHQSLREYAARLAQFKRTLDHTRDGVFIFDPATLRFSYVNQGALQQVGYSEEELLRMTPLDIKPDCEEPSFRAMLQQLTEGHLPEQTFETRYRHKDGHDISVEIVLQYITCDEAMSCFIAFARDITARKLAEAELRIAAVAFEMQESMLITDANGVILRVNQAFSQNSGYTSEEAVGQTPRMLKSGRHDAEFYAGMWKTLLNTGAWQGEIWDRRKNGEIYPKLLTISAVKGMNGTISHYVGTHIDITERKESEEEIRNLFR
jgi:PAS domain S-box-containing protein